MKQFHYDSMEKKYRNFAGIEFNYSHSQMHLVQHYPNVVIKGNVGTNEVRNWCEEMFGDDWIYNYNTFYFKREEDATLFALKWR